MLYVLQYTRQQRLQKGDRQTELYMIRITIANASKDMLATSASKKSAYINFDYDSEILSNIKALYRRIYHPDTKQWEVPLSSVASVCNSLPRHSVSILATREESTDPHINIPKDFSWLTKPYKHQIDGVIYGLTHQNFLLGDDQGLGKTKVAIDIARARKKMHGIKHCLIICGINGTKYNWQNEVAMHSEETAWVLGTRFTKKYPVRAYEGSSQDKLDDLNNLPNDFFLITNIESLRQLSTKKGNKRVYPIADKIQELCESGEIGMIIFDEAHKAKNPQSQQGKALLRITADVPKIAMSGTFVLNNPLDLYLPLKWIGAENHSYFQFKNYYCIMGGFNGSEVIGFKNLGELRNIVSSVMLRRTKHDVLDLPPKVHTVEYVDMFSAQAKLYDDVKKIILADIDKIKLSPDPLAQIIRLRQVTGYPGLISSTVTESAKLDRLEELVEEITSVGEKAIVYSQWEKMTEILRERLAKYNPAYITGSVKSEERMSEVNKFQNDPRCKIIIGTIGAMGTGLTLTAATNVIFLDEPWSRALKDQAEDRAHRIGTQGTVRVITLICKNTIDERIYHLVQKKGELSDLLIDGKVNSNKARQLVDYLLS